MIGKSFILRLNLKLNCKSLFKGAMFFGVTLLTRKIMTPFQFNAVFLTGTLGIFFATVLFQEVHIPFVSTQKLIIPCTHPEPGTLLETLGKYFLFYTAQKQLYMKFMLSTKKDVFNLS